MAQGLGDIFKSNGRFCEPRKKSGVMTGNDGQHWDSNEEEKKYVCVKNFYFYCGQWLN
jgi:hypothetical protein